MVWPRLSSGLTLDRVQPPGRGPEREGTAKNKSTSQHQSTRANIAIHSETLPQYTYISASEAAQNVHRQLPLMSCLMGCDGLKSRGPWPNWKCRMKSVSLFSAELRTWLCCSVWPRAQSGRTAAARISSTSSLSRGKRIHPQACSLDWVWKRVLSSISHPQLGMTWHERRIHLFNAARLSPTWPVQGQPANIHIAPAGCGCHHGSYW